MNKELSELLWWTWRHRFKLMDAAPGQRGQKHRSGRNTTVVSTSAHVLGKPHMSHYHRERDVSYSNRATKMIYRQYNKSKYNRIKIEPVYADIDGLLLDYIHDVPEQLNKAREAALLQFRQDVVVTARELGVESVYLQGKPDRTIAVGDIPSVDVNAWNSFVHFYPKRGRGNFRVYLNMKDTQRTKYFREIMKNLKDVPGFYGGKILSPGAGRSDNALFFMGTRSAQDEAVAHIKDNWSQLRRAFYPGVPRLTQPVVGLTGVSIATSPPRVQILSDGDDLFYDVTNGMSFGMYRAHVIFMALDNSELGWHITGPRYYWKFKRNVAKYFKLAGIDIDNPHKQARTAALKPLDALHRKLRDVDAIDCGVPLPQRTFHNGAVAREEAGR